MSNEKDVPDAEEEREQRGQELELEEHKSLERSVVDMAISRIEDIDGLFVGGLWALRRSDSLLQRGITHVLSVVSFRPSDVKNFKNEPFSEYGKPFKHLLMDVDDVEDEDILIHMPQAVSFIDQGLTQNLHNNEEETTTTTTTTTTKRGAVFVHCAAGKSRSVSMVVAYLLWKYPSRFDPATTTTTTTTTTSKRPRKETAAEAIAAAVDWIRRTRPMAEPNEGFMQQLALWWEWDCPEDMEAHPAYQRWAYQREVKESVNLGQAPSRLRFEDEVARPATSSGTTSSLRCKKCRRTLATAPFVLSHDPPCSDSSPTSSSSSPSPSPAATVCQHFFIEPLSWMRAELEKGEMSGRLCCPNARCGAGVGRYDWKGFRCTCGAWVTHGFSLQRGRVDEEVQRGTPSNTTLKMGIRMPPGYPRGGGHL